MLLDHTHSKSTFKKDSVSEKPMRSIAKAISWRMVGTMDTIGISWLLTGEVQTALAIGSLELITKMILYFGHERLWNKINFGRE